MATAYRQTGREFVRDLAAALGLDRPVIGVTLHARCDSLVTVEVELPVTEEQAAKVVEVVRRYGVRVEGERGDA